ncbi:hypothetical protein RM61_20775 [Xanthomonas phaseoli pv. phaseoli]|nr:hypothetical protein RM61_20775 [Xanthomonas phaseoli pv. phaseoli]
MALMRGLARAASRVSVAVAALRGAGYLPAPADLALHACAASENAAACPSLPAQPAAAMRDTRRSGQTPQAR